jgi:hypothetical protein
MDSGVPLNPSFSTTSPMVFSHFMGTNSFVFHNGMQNHDTQSIPWASNHLSLDMTNMRSLVPSSPSPNYMNPSFGSGGMMTPLYTSSFDRSHIPQPTLTVEGCNIPSYRSNPSFTFIGESAQMGSHSTYYISSIYPSSTMLVLMNDFYMEYLHLSFGVSSRGSQFYSMGNPLHEFPSSGGNIYPHLSNPYHVAFSSQATSSVTMPLQPFMNQFGGGYFPIG